MKVLDNPQLKATILRWLSESYLKSTYRPSGMHLTDLIYCLTKSFWDKTDPLPPSEREVLLFASGLGLERVLIPKEYKAEPILIDNIWVSPDFFTNIMGELKTTRMSSKKALAGDLPETWIEQIKGYAKASNQLSYDLAALCLMGNWHPPFPELIGLRLEFEQDEIDSFWAYIMEERLPCLESHLTSPYIPPLPQCYCKDWECKDCRYKMGCRAYCIEKGFKWEER